MTKKCFYCGEWLTQLDFDAGVAIKTGRDRYAHTDCIDSHGKDSATEKVCMYCSKEVTDTQFRAGLAVKTIHDLYAHTKCIDSSGKENTMSSQTQDILGAADYAHQSIGLAKELLQESLGNVGQVLTCGCMNLGPASLGSTMRLGQKLKELSFVLDDLLKDAHGLCVLLGHDLGVVEDEVTVLAPGPECPSNTSRYRFDMFGDNLADMVGEPLGTPDHRDLMDVLDSDDFLPGEDEFDDDEQPF